MPKRFILRLVAIVAALVSCASPVAARPVPFGVYAYYPQSWNAEVAQNFPIVFVQYQSWTRDASKIRNIKNLAASGSRVVIDFEFLQSTDQRRERKPMSSLDDVVDDARYLFSTLKGVPLEAVTLDEENSPSSKRLARLSALYTILKKEYPDHRFLQWISASDVTHLDRLNLISVPADGWVIDPYRLPASEYAAYVAAMRDITDRIYSIVWAAPEWQVGAGFRKQARSAWWDDQQWKTFYGQLAVNQANGIPSIFYLFGLNSGRSAMAWEGDECARKFYSVLTGRLVPYVSTHSLPITVPDVRPNWLPGYC